MDTQQALEEVQRIAAITWAALLSPPDTDLRTACAPCATEGAE